MVSARTVLVVTSVEDVTANLVIAVLNERGAQVVRADPADIGPNLVFSARIGDGHPNWAGRLRTPSRDIALEDVQAVYYRRPSPWHFKELGQQARDFAGTEARHGLGGLLANLPNCRYVNHPVDVTRADFKPAQLQVAARLGLAVPATLITNDAQAARQFATQQSVVYKAFRGVPADPNGDVGAIWTQRVNSDDLNESISVTAHLFQEEVPKTSDARVTVIGRRMFASRITTPDSALDWRSGDWDALVHAPVAVPEPIRAALYAYLDHFGLVFGCF
ncbi:MvdC/MvdD family ATP grasp protein [Streptosporangium subroseum]|uniref:MvdC/MvdD family ATP grasp protein n=1 Tax=Streptosporangium subroseum TaxID=106412 RepID=UPI003449F0C0